ncbi:MAG: NAD(P)/FAD-dependent oxidoreductase [Pyrinomonadaceae bacterium]
MKNLSGTQYDVVIVGGGPAGMSAALWCSELGLSSIIIDEGTSPGGQLHTIHNAIANYPGAYFANGAECIGAFRSSLERHPFNLISNAVVETVNAESVEVLVGDHRLKGKALILATGVRRRRLNVIGEDEFRDNGILVSGVAQRRSVKGKHIAVIGGGDAALENALLLSEFAEQVYLIHRGREFTAREEFVERVASEPKIKSLMSSTVRSINGDSQLRSVTVGFKGGNRDIELDHLIIRIGVDPNSELVRSQLETDTNGYVVVDATCRTSARACFAIGDVASPLSPTIATAVGMGATAAKNIQKIVR